MKSVVAFVSLALLGCAAIWAQNLSRKVGGRESSAMTQQTTGAATTPVAPSQVSAAVEKGARWLASVQGTDGGWGQDGGATSHIRQTESLESKGNDVANTALAALALLRAGNQYRPQVERAVAFILQRVEASPPDGLSVTDVKETQIQRKLGPYIDTFLASMLLAQADPVLAKANKARARSGLEKCVAKIERNQMSDGSWNVGGGWAPVLGTSLASRSLFEAGKNGVKVDREVMARAESYTVKSQKDRGPVTYGGAGVGAGVGRGSATDAVSVSAVAGRGAPAALPAAAGVELYQDAQALEQLSRTPEDRKKNAKEITAIHRKLSDATFVAGYGSIGGEEFFSYLNISDGLKRSDGKEWAEWYAKTTQKILKLQNSDGTWAGHHCITGRVAVTSAAILNLTPDREH
jgi:Squalene-hopene cyclase C-terminal domain/Prenyltransferase and squalene oxidase repeat